MERRASTGATSPVISIPTAPRSMICQMAIRSPAVCLKAMRRTTARRMRSEMCVNGDGPRSYFSVPKKSGQGLRVQIAQVRYVAKLTHTR